MKRTKLFLIALLAIILTVSTSYSQVTVSGANSGNGSYGSLGAAMTAIGVSQAGATITVSITASTSEGASTVTIGAGTWTSLTISPSGGSWTISGATTAGTPMIDFSGADNVTINGLNSGGNALTIDNTTSSATSGTSTIRFINGATNNTITNCTIKGSGSASVATNGAVIFFSTDGSTANGNDNNTISNNDIGPSGSNLPTKCILGNGSTTTTAIGNSGIVIRNNNIHDYFGAAVTSAGVATNGGCNSWTIDSNRFYQSASRTWTTGAVHNAILLTPSTATSGMTGAVVINNIIGYSSNSQTGTYTLTGSTGIMRAIHITAYGSSSSGTLNRVSKNTINAISMTGVTSSGTSTGTPFIAILANTGIFNTDSNTIGSQTGTGAITYSTNTTTATDVYGIYNFSSDDWNCRNNTIGSFTANNAGASGAFIFYGLRANTSSTKSTVMTNNLIGGTTANSISSNSTSTTAQMIGIHFVVSAGTITSNTIRNITAAGGTGTGTAASVIGISTSSASSNNHTVGSNIIHTLSNTSSAGAVTVTGIMYGGTTGTNTIEKNFIHSFSLVSSSVSATMNGISVNSATATYKNNMIRLGIDASGSSITAGVVINGINETVAGTDNFYNNSVYIGGSGVVTTAANTFAFNSTIITNTRAYQDNIFWNARSNSTSTGKHYGIKVGGTTVNPTGLTTNYNVIYVNGTGGTFGFYNSADVASLSAWQTATGQDGNSINNSAISFIAETGTSSTVDLHLHATNPTVCEGSGLSIGAVTDDYDGQTRSGLTPTDIGADAGNFVAQDVSGPIISYSALGNIPASNNQTLTATISDASGVPQAGANQPTLYYKSTTSVPSYTAVTGSWVSGNTYTFSFGAAVTGTGETVSYFIVAQDNVGTPNLSCFPATGASGLTANPPAAGTPPSAPSTYTTASTLSGTYTVGSGGTYTTLKAAFDDINAKVVNGNITLSILSGGTTETATASLNQVSYFGGTFTITITPASGTTPTITGALGGTALIKLNGADNVVIDGSNTQTTTKDLTLTNTGSTASTTVVWLASQGTGGGCTSSTIKNCNMNTGGNATASSYGIFAGSTTIGTAGDDNDNLTIQNNSISKCYVGMSIAANATGLNNNLSITQNSVGSNTAGSEVLFKGIEVIQATGANVNNNTIFNLNTGTVTGDPCGLVIGTGVVSSTFNANSISDINGAASGGYGGRGITVNTGSASSSLTISNNLIWNIKGTGWNTMTSDVIAGILIGNSAATTGGLNIYFNTVNLGSGTFSGNTSGTLSAAFAIAQSGPTNLDIRNNIFATNLVNSAASGALTYAIYTGTTNTAFTSINYNCYYGTGSQSRVGFLGSAQTTLAGWQGVSGQDANSTISDPAFTSSTDLHISQAGSAYHTGLNGLSVTTDYTGATRNNPPSMGAYDAGVNTGPTISYTPLGNGIASTNQVLTAAIADAVDGVPTAGSGLPTLYYKSTTSVPAYTAVQGVYVSGNNYSFTFGSSVTGTGETVSYYIVAQDNAGLITQVTCSPSTGASGFSVNPPAVSTPPTTPSTYTTLGALSGTKTVGSGGDYATLKAAFDDINAKVLTGNLALSILAGGTTETATASLNAVSYSGGTWTVTISPASGQTPTITGALASTSIIKLNGADNVVIDGSNNGSTSKDLTITNSSTTAPSVIWLASQGAGAGCTSNTIKNCNITTGIGTTLGYHICLGGTTIGTSGADNDNVTIQNNTLTNAIVGIYAIGTATTSSGGNDNLNITQNTISSNASNAVTGTKAIQLGNGLNGTISQNSIVMQSSGASSVVGISLEAGFTSSTITRNSIQSFSNNSAGEGGRGITCSSGSASSSLTISNNILYNINGSNWTGFNNSSSMGIALGVDGTTTTVTSTAGGINLYNNSVYMSGNYTGTGFSGACLTACLYVGSGASVLDIRNNVFENTLNNQNAGGTASKNYAIYSIAANTAFSSINYNTYYVSGAQGVLGFLTSDRTNLAGIVSGFGGNANSLNADPQFTSTTNLVPVSSATSVIPELNSGTFIAGVTTDYNGSTRSSTNPDMGAYEFTASLDLTGASNTTLPGGGYTGLTWTANTCTFSGNATIDGALTLSNGIIDMGANTLTIGTSTSSLGSVTRTGGSIKGTLKRWFGTSTTTNSVFPLDYGDGTNYVGALISFTGAPTTGGTLTATFHSSGAGSLADNGGLGYIDVGGLWPGVNFINLAQQYWTISAGDGLAGFTYDITLIANNMNVSATSYLYTGVVKRSNNSQPWAWNQSSHVNTTSPGAVPTLGGTGFTSFSDFGVSGNVDNLLPVELAAFTANIDKRHVMLNWSTVSETNNTGYDIERKNYDSQIWSKISFVEGHGTTSLPQSYKYEDRNLASGKYNYRLKQIDNNGNYHYIPLTTLVEIGIPTKYDMSQNYPNPFNPSTKINFDLPFDSKVTIRLFDITGREVATVLNQTVVAGYQTVQFNAAGLASGTYFYNIMAEGNNGNKFVNTKKMVLVK